MREVDPMNTDRAACWQLYRNAPMPMVTIFKTLDITNLMALKAKGYRLNMLLCYCVAMAAGDTPEFKLLPVGEKLLAYDTVGVNVLIANRSGGLSACDIPYLDTLDTFGRAYEALTRQVYETCRDHTLDDGMIVGTSSLIRYEIDGAVNMYGGVFNNPFLIWGKYRAGETRTTLRLSFQFHHVQMDGAGACAFLDRLQTQICALTAE